MTVSSSYVHYTIQKHTYEVLELRRKFKRRIPRHIPINEIWAIDMTGKGDITGAIHSILGIVDHGSRKLVSLDALHNKNAWTLLGHLFLSIGRYGKPRWLRSDNDAVFKSRIFRLILALAGIKQQFSDPGCPWMNGRIERLFGSLKSKLNRFKIDGRETLATMLTEFSFWYNAVRPHQHLNGCTPNEVWYDIDPYAKAPRSVRLFTGWDGALQGYYLRF
jgi:transposase InsO family protein